MLERKVRILARVTPEGNAGAFEADIEVPIGTGWDWDLRVRYIHEGRGVGARLYGVELGQVVDFMRQLAVMAHVPQGVVDRAVKQGRAVVRALTPNLMNPPTPAPSSTEIFGDDNIKF